MVAILLQLILLLTFISLFFINIIGLLIVFGALL